MKNILPRLFSVIAIASLLLLAPNVQAQNPIHEKGFSFQSYARDFDGNPLGNKSVFAKFSIYETGKANAPSFEETHELTTDAFGVFTTIVGSVSQATFFGLDWMNKNYNLKAEVSINNSDFVVVSDTQLLSVPYAQAAANGNPVGTIISYGGDVNLSLPDGYLVCDGSLKNISDYQKLFNAVGTSWGGDGTSTFRVPDLRGRFLRGVDDGEGNDPDAAARIEINANGNTGDNVGSLQGGATARPNTTFVTGQDGNHSHNYTNPLIGSFAGLDNDSNGSATEYPSVNAGTTSTAGLHDHRIDAGGDAETRPINANVWYIIKY